ncbi:MAG: CNP1-like family protein [Thiomonas sp.]|uniref:CNP1-like family protein n=1 Tax=Thiomonas sp. TaxID=2047785 RepID=UPI002A36CB91|nr:CNP1-like family protein [Thiomonas sp.]MDY0330528.1 CNP1-like family protein [Thiomonas sp.]
MIFLTSARTRAALLAGLLLGLGSGQLVKARTADENGLFGAKSSAAEAPVVFPPAPTALVHVHITASGAMQFFIDRSSVTVEPGQTVRYTLVGKTPDGPPNITYEGINCATRQWKLYGLWNDASQKWVAATGSDWQGIPENGAMRVHSTLYRDDFCRDQSVRGTAADLVRRVELGLHAPSD